MEELTTETQAKRPVLLTVLVILSAIYIIGKKKVKNPKRRDA